MQAGGKKMASVFYEQRSEGVFAGMICDHPFPPHVHSVVEIVCLTRGTMEMSIAGQKYRMQAGDIVVAFPNITHSYDAVSPDAQGLTLIFLPNTISEFTTRFRTEVPVSPLLRSADKAAELDLIIRKLLSLSESGESPLTLGYLHLFLSYLFQCLALSPQANPARSELAYQVLQYISEHFTEPLSLESTAHALGISRIHLSHIFSQQLQINFRQYINTLRIDRACMLLRDPSCTISQIIGMCGYENARTFHRAFLSQCSMPPNQYRSRMQKSNETVPNA